MTKSFFPLTAGQIQRSLRQYARHVINTACGARIILIDRNIADVFTGTGWGNRSRYRLMGGKWAYVSGIRLSAGTAALLPSR
jgi:hypothetical protein